MTSALPKLAILQTLLGTALGAGLFLATLGVMALASLLLPLLVVGHGEAKEQKLLLEQIDRPALLATLRDYAARQRWNSATPAEVPSLPDGTVDLSKLPPELQRLKPKYIWLDDDAIALVYGGALGHWGIRAFRPAVAGAGLRQLAAGLWFFTDDDDTAREKPSPGQHY